MCQIQYRLWTTVLAEFSTNEGGICILSVVVQHPGGVHRGLDELHREAAVVLRDVPAVLVRDLAHQLLRLR